MPVLPIDLQTIISQMSNAGKIQQQQQMAGAQLQQENNLQDAKKLKMQDEQVEDTKQLDENQVKDATKKENAQAESGGEAQEKTEPEGLINDKEPENLEPPSSKGKIIDTLG